MLNNGKMSGCGYSDDLVAYVYDEIEAGAKRKFESHMASCVACSEEFAALADTRLSVFQWREQEFSGLPTPAFELPYENAEEPRPTGFFAGLRELLISNMWPVTAAATVAVVIGIGFAGIILYSGGNDNIARVEVVSEPAADPIGNDVKDVGSEPDVIDTVVEKKPEAETTPVSANASEIRPTAVRRSDVGTGNPSRRTVQKPSVSTRAVQVPSLSGFDETEDNSLRLSDLLDEIGG